MDLHTELSGGLRALARRDVARDALPHLLPDLGDGEAGQRARPPRLQRAPGQVPPAVAQRRPALHPLAGKPSVITTTKQASIKTICFNHFFPLTAEDVERDSFRSYQGQSPNPFFKIKTIYYFNFELNTN